MSRLEGAEAFRRAQEAYCRESDNRNANPGAGVAGRGFTFEEHPGVERLVARVEPPATVYEAPRSKKRLRNVQ